MHLFDFYRDLIRLFTEICKVFTIADLGINWFEKVIFQTPMKHLVEYQSLYRFSHKHKQKEYIG